MNRFALVVGYATIIIFGIGFVISCILIAYYEIEDMIEAKKQNKCQAEKGK